VERTSDPNTTASANRRPARTLWFALGVALVLRIVIGADLFANDPLTRAPVSDALYYDAWARTAAAGQVWRPGEAHWMPPLYPWLLGVWYGVSGGALGATLALQGLVGLVNTWLFAQLARRVVAGRAFTFALFAWVLYGPLVLTENRLLAENAALPCVLAGLVSGVNVLERLRSGRAAPLLAIAAGLCFGLAALARPNLVIGPLGFAIGAWLDLVRARRAGESVAAPRVCSVVLALAALGAALPLGVGLASNLARADAAVLVSANGGVNFFLGNNPSARGTFAAPGPQWGDIFAQRAVAFGEAARELGTTPEALDERAVSRHFFGKGLAWIVEHPLDAALLWSRKAAASLSSHEYDVQVVEAAVRESARSLWLVCLPFGAVLACAVLSRARGVRWSGALIGWIVAVEIAVLLYFSYSRFRLPWYPALVPFAAVGCASLFERERRPRLGVLVLAGGVLAASFAPTEGSYARALRANALVDAARALEARAGDPSVQEQRMHLLERALAVEPNDAKALSDLARIAVASGDERRALELLERANRVDFPPVRLELAQLLWSARDSAVYDPRRGRALVTDYIAQRGAEAWGALELGLALGDELVRRAPFEPSAADEARALVAALAAVHRGDERFDALAARVAALP
jgi:hypothetical protein